MGLGLLFQRSLMLRKGNIGDEEFVAYKKSSEIPQVFSSGNVMFYTDYKRYSFGLGLGISTYKERANYNREETVKKGEWD